MEIEQAEFERLVNRSRLMDLAQDILIVLDKFGDILDVNDAAAEMHGGETADFIGRNCAEFLHPSSAKQMMDIALQMGMAGQDCTDSMELKAIRDDGSTVYLQLRVSYSMSEEKFYVVERDVTEQTRRTSELVAMAEELRMQATTDTLTSIPNRTAFEDAMSLVEDLDADAWLVILDIDFFKAVNDTYGHVVGDGLLRSVAKALSTLMGPNDLVARIGGDEFAMVLPDLEEPEVDDRLDQIARVLRKQVIVDGVALNVSCSFGGTRRVPGETVANWMRRSDREMYVRKAMSRNVIEAA